MLVALVHAVAGEVLDRADRRRFADAVEELLRALDTRSGVVAEARVATTVLRQLRWMSTIGANAQLQPSAAVSRPATCPIWWAIDGVRVRAGLQVRATSVPSSMLPKPPISGLDAISSGIFDRDCA